MKSVNALLYLIFTSIVWETYTYYSQFTGETIETRRRCKWLAQGDTTMGSHARFELRLPHCTNWYLILEAGDQPLHLIGEKPHGCSYIVFVFHNVYTLYHFGKDKCTLQLVIETADFSKNLLLQSFVYHYGLPTYHELPQLQSSLDSV